MSGAPSRRPSAELRPFPQALEAERAVLGGLLLLASDPTRVRELCAMLDAREFYSAEHGRLFDLIRRRSHTVPVDVLEVADHLMQTGEAESYGGLAYVSSLPERVPTTENLESYIRIVRDRATRRAVMAFATRVRDAALNEPNGAEEVLASITRELEHLMAEHAHTAPEDAPIEAVADQWMLDLEAEQRAIRMNLTTGLPWGFPALRKFGGLRPKQVVVIAARPGMGKSELMFQLLYRLAKHCRAQGLGCVVVHSLEMPREDVFDRWAAAITHIPYSRIHEKLTDDEIYRLRDAAEELRALPIVINDRPAQSVQAMRRTVTRAARKWGRVVAFGVDYIQLAEDEDPAARKAARYEQIAKICKAVAAMAKDFESVAILAAQLNRGCEARADKRPMASDMREGGDLEQVAHVILCIYRDGYYNPESANSGEAEIICCKNRSGGTQGTIKLGWANGTFSDGIARNVDPAGFRMSAEEWHQTKSEEDWS